MKIGVIGLGKLGMPFAVAMTLAGHEVIGYDVLPERMSKNPWPFQEQGYEGKSFDELLQEANLSFASLEMVVSKCNPVFVVVPTPHDRQYEGVTRLPLERRDFDYRALRQVIRHIKMQSTHPAVAIVSTVLPGTIEREILPIYEDVVYNPAFAAMGTVVQDVLKPEFVLLGLPNEDAGQVVRDVYFRHIYPPPITMSIPSAELLKVVYNTFITTKIVFANTVMELCHHTGASVNAIYDVLRDADRRIISPMYLRGGMGDGGACHPRDNIALSWLAEQTELSFDLFSTLMIARERQAEFLCNLVNQAALLFGLKPFVLGTAFKAGSNIQTGSAAMLCVSILKETWKTVETWDPHANSTGGIPDSPRVFLIGCNHRDFGYVRFPVDSVVIDPWRMIPDQEGVSVIRIGE